MDYKSIGILLMKLGSYCFDVGSDILNGLHFLHNSRNTAINGIFNSTTEGTLLHNETKFYNLSEGSQEVEINKPDTIWGTLTLSWSTLVFVPGITYGVIVGIGYIVEGWKKCGIWIRALGFLSFSAFFPVIVPIYFMKNIGRLMLKK